MSYSTIFSSLGPILSIPTDLLANLETAVMQNSMRNSVTP